MRVTGRTIAATAAMLASATALGACGSDDDGSGNAGAGGGVSELVVGVQGVFSGELASYGDRQKGGVLYALQDAGPLKIGGQPVEVKLVYADDEGSAEKGPVAAQQLVDEDADVVIGPAFSGPAAAAIPRFRQAKIPAVSPSTGADNLTPLGGGWFFRVALTNACQAEMMVDIAQDKGASSIAIVDDNEAYGADISKSLTEDAKAAGLTVYGPFHGQAGQTDWSSVVTRLSSSNPDLIFYNGYFTEAGRLIAQARDRGVRAPFVGSDGVADAGIFDVAPASKLTDVSGVTVAPAELLAGTESDDWAALQDAYPAFAESEGLSTTEPDIYVAQAYDAMNLVLDAVKRAGSADGDELREALQSTEYRGLTGDFTYSETGEREGCRGGYLELRGERFEPASS
jgi:branched-chain amino acid transport system substrate-binding protein